MKQLLIILICLWLWLISPAIINAEPIGEEIDSQGTEKLAQPVATYYLLVLGGVGRREVNFNPPATKIAVTSQSGDITIRCGDEQNTYSCSPGKRLEIEYEATTPVVKFWGENLSDTQVRLQIDVYQTVPPEQDVEENEETNRENMFPQSQSVTGEST